VKHSVKPNDETQQNVPVKIILYTMHSLTVKNFELTRKERTLYKFLI